MNIILSQQDPDDPQVDVESDRNRASRQKQLFSSIHYDGKEAKRHTKLDRYFSQHPPNGPMLSIYRDVLAAFVNSSGETPRWLTYPQLFTSFERLEKRAVLKIEMTVDELNIRHYKSTSTANRRNVRPAQLDSLVTQLKQDLGTILDQPAIPPESVPTVYGCRQVTTAKWRVSLYFGGSQRALGCYSFETALRIQDVLTLHFSPYRRPAHYNTSAEHAAELLAQHPALRAFAEALEAHWLATGVLCRPGIDKTEEQRQAIETRLTVIESSLREINQKLGT